MSFRMTILSIYQDTRIRITGISIKIIITLVIPGVKQYFILRFCTFKTKLLRNILTIVTDGCFRNSQRHYY
jgi:hypothetical protein